MTHLIIQGQNEYSLAYRSPMSSYILGLLMLCFLLPTSGNAQNSSSVKKIILKAVGGMQYDIIRFKVSPGEQVRLILKNTDDMDHNLIITLQGKREEIVKAALEMGDWGPAKNFVPESSSVLFHIPIISPGEEAALTFRAPITEGIYPYVCTYPGHGTIMYGAMYVTTGEMPPISEDFHIPEHRRSGNADPSASTETPQIKWHPYELIPPYSYRIFMPESGPASIAVRLSGDLAYCWDAGVCRLRYIWEGDFLDISKPWSIKGDASAEILGTVFYLDKEEHPLQIGKDSSEIQYRGYRLKEGGFLEFHYTVGGVDVFELIKPLANEKRLARQFTIPHVKEDIVFTYTPQPGVTVTSDLGKWDGKVLKLTKDEAKDFTIFIEPTLKSKDDL